MSYDLLAIAERVVLSLQTNPRLTLLELAVTLQVDRHTIWRALAIHKHTTFRSLQLLCLEQRLAELQADIKPRSRKQIAVGLGYGSSRALRRRLGRSVPLSTKR